MYITSNARERHRYFDQAVSEMREGLNEPSVQQRLGNLALVRLQNLDDVYYLNFDQDRMSIPRHQLDTVGIPVTVVRPGEALILDQTFASNNVVQLSRMRRQMRSWHPAGGSDMVEADIASLPSMWQKIGDEYRKCAVPADRPPMGVTTNRALPVVLRDYRNLGKHSARLLIGRPLVALVLNPDSENPFASWRLWHETTHVRDDEEQPFIPYDNALREDLWLRRELLAYHLDYFYAIGLYHSDNPKFSGVEILRTNHGIEALRQEHLDERKDQFEPIGALKRALRGEHMDHIYMET